MTKINRDEIIEDANVIIGEGGTTADVVEHVIEKIARAYSWWNDGCSCCQSSYLAKELGYADDDDEDLDEEE